MKKSNVYFSSIYDCPIYCFEKAKEHSNPAFFKKENLYVAPKNVEFDNSNEGYDLFNSFLDEISEEFGISDNFKEEIHAKKMIIEACLRHIESGNRFELNSIRMWQKTLEKLQENKTTELSFAKRLKMLSEELKFPIDPKKTTIHQYLSFSI